MGHYDPSPDYKNDLLIGQKLCCVCVYLGEAAAARCNLVEDERSMTVRPKHRHKSEQDSRDARTHREGMKIIVLLLSFLCVAYPSVGVCVYSILLLFS